MNTLREAYSGRQSRDIDFQAVYTRAAEKRRKRHPAIPVAVAAAAAISLIIGSLGVRATIVRRQLLIEAVAYQTELLFEGSRLRMRGVSDPLYNGHLVSYDRRPWWITPADDTR